MCAVLGVLLLILIFSACTQVAATTTPEHQPTPTPTPSPEEVQLQAIGDSVERVLEDIDKVSDSIANQGAYEDYMAATLWALYDGLTKATQKGTLHLQFGSDSLVTTLGHKDGGRYDEAIAVGKEAVQRFNRALNNFWWVHDQMVRY